MHCDDIGNVLHRFQFGPILESALERDGFVLREKLFTEALR